MTTCPCFEFNHHAQSSGFIGVEPDRVVLRVGGLVGRFVIWMLYQLDMDIETMHVKPPQKNTSSKFVFEITHRKNKTKKPRLRMSQVQKRTPPCS